MVQVNGMEFATNIGVLFALKEAKGYKTIQETYKLLENSNIDVMIDVLRVSYNKHNKVNLTIEQFVQELENKGIGFFAIADVFQKVIEALMFDGLSPEEVEAKKKLARQVSLN